jgi:hypothetical protein
VAIVLTLYKLSALLGAVILPDIETALKIKAAFESLGPDYKANVQQLASAADQANDETIAKVNAWLTANGFDPLPPDPAAVK